MNETSAPASANAAIEQGEMRALQWFAVILLILLNALDGYDVLASAFAGPGIAKAWHIDKAQLGVVLSMELLGMSTGSLLLGGAADTAGRRPTILSCLVVMLIGMYGATTASDMTALLAWRLFTGIGIGGMLAAINAAAAELSSLRWRSIAMTLMVIGYPIGGVLGGQVISHFQANFDWRSVFYLGAGATATLLPFVFFFVPETPAWLEHKRPDGALERINAVLRRFSHPQLAALPPPDQDQRKASIVDILKGVYLQRTLLLTLSYGFTVMALYYILKWVPKIVVDMGHKPNEAAGVLTYANLGGVVGGLVLGPLIHRFGIKWPTIGMLAGSMVMISLFGYDNDRTTLGMWSLSTAACQFFTNAAVAGFYLAFVASYPTHARATATGFGIGVGRLGAWLSPMFAGLLFKANYSLAVVSLIMSCTSLVALLCLLPLRFEKR